MSTEQGAGPRRFRLAVGATTFGVASILAACGSGAPVSSGSGSGGTKVPGGTAYLAEAPNASPNYIFPLAPPGYFSTVNMNQFQVLMYRPLYWFGNHGKPTINYRLSIGQAPQYSHNNTVVTVKLNHYVWSDGETVSSRDVVFWMNLLKAEKANWGAYVPGGFPDNVTSVSAPNPTTVVFHLNRAYNPTWFTYNELSQITPLPLAWDRTSASAPIPSPGATNLPDTTSAGIAAVYKFLSATAKTPSSFATNPLWSVVDGPWKLQSYTATGQATFIPNPKYAGPVKPTISKFVELPFTSSTAEFNLLTSGPNKITVGTLPTHDAPKASTLTSLGYNINGNAFPFAFNYFVINFNNPTYGPVFRQLYFRQALQHLVDQPGWIHAFYHGYGTPTYGPVPIKPANNFADSLEKSNPYPFSPSAAKSLLAANGWHVVPGGTTTCAKPGAGPGECGAGIPKGLPLTFNLDYASGMLFLSNSMQNLKSTAAQVGIQIQLSEHPFGTVIGAAVPCKSSQASCHWTMENWGAGWVYDPGFYPTGGELFSTGASSNYGNYSSAQANALISASHASASASALNAYQDYIAKQLPVIFTPSPAGTPVAGGPVVTASNLRGFTPNPYTFINPEEWYFVK